MTAALPGPLHHRRFRTLWAASVISNLGGFIQAVAASWLMLDLTGSPAWVSAMVASTTLPLLFLALPSGALADLANRRTMLLVAQSIMGGAVAVMAGVSFADKMTPPLLLALGLVVGVGVALNAPVWQSVVPDLVPRQIVASAVALNSASFNAARAVGPALGGLLVVTAGPEAAFAVNAVTFVLVIGVILTFPSGRFSAREDSTLLSAMALGIRYVRFTPALRWLLGLSAGFALTSMALQALLPNLTQDVLEGGAALYGILLGAMGVGALAGAATRRRFGMEFGRRTVATAVAMYGAVGIGIGLSPFPWLTAVLMAAAGLCWVWALATLNATIQILSHPWVRGRAMSLYLLSFTGVVPLGSLLAGSIADHFGIQEAILGLSAGALLVGLSALRMPIIGIDDVEAPHTAEHWDFAPHGDMEIPGGPVLVMNTWIIDEDFLSEFLEAMTEVRLVRLRTGAYRWRLYRDFDDPRRMTEAWNLASWEDHLHQHQRIDEAAAEVIRRARSFDTGDGPVSRHLVALDVTDPSHHPDWPDLVARHHDAHQTDGSIPLLSVEKRPEDRG